jgi:carboxypeptidase Taq
MHHKRSRRLVFDLEERDSKDAPGDLVSSKEASSHVDVDLNQNDQLEVCKIVLNLIGYDWNRGRLDLSVHPFSSAYHPYDSRITTRAESHGFVIQVFTTLHEAGHSFYEMGLPVEHYGTPLGEAISLGVHENESRFWETRIGKSAAFWNCFFPKLVARFPEAFKKLDFQKFYKEINRVRPSLIRTDADEVTYPLHVVLRFELEKELISGKLSTKDLPDRWNHEMKQLLGIEPKNNAEGCLQDIHWSMGAFGYFPTYTLGNIYAAIIFDTFQKENPDWQKKVERDEFEFIKEWRQKNIHCHGRRYTSKELIQKISSKPVTTDPYLRYLREKHLNIFA